jgi:hypothetical protein
VKKKVKGTTGAAPASRLRGTKAETVDEPTQFDPEMLGERYRKLTEVHESLVVAFKDNPASELHQLRRQLLRQSRSLHEEGAADASGAAPEVDKLLALVTGYRRRWTSLHASFEKHSREYRKAKSMWDARSLKMAEASVRGTTKVGDHRKADTLLDRALRISEKFSSALSSADADLLVVALGEAQKSWPELKKRAEADLEDRAAQRLAAAKLKVKTGAPVAKRTSTGSTRPRPAWKSQRADGKRRTSAVVPKVRARKVEPETPAATAAKGADSSKQADSAAPPPTSTFKPLVWALSGFAVASVLFWLATRPGSLRGLARRGNTESRMN